MAETLINTHADPAVHAFDLAVVLSGTTITVQSNAITIKMNGADWTFAADEVFTVVNRLDVTELVAYIVIDTTPDPDEIRVFVDEYIQDGVDEPYKFVRGAQYTLLAYLYRITIPASTTDVSGFDIDRWRMIAPA